MFDIVVIISVLIPFLFFLKNKLNKKETWIEVNVRLTHDYVWSEQTPSEYWYTWDINKGDKIINSFGEVVGEVADIISYEESGYSYRTDIIVKLKVTYNKNNDQYFFDFQPLQIGKPINLSLSRNEVTGFISSFDKNGIAFKEKKVEMFVSHLRPWQANSFKEGMVYKDRYGKELAVIESVRTRYSIENMFSDIRGRYIQVTNDEYRDIFLVVNLKAVFTIGDNSNFINGTPIRVGSKIWLFFPSISVEAGEISKVFD